MRSEERAPVGEKANLLAVTQVLTGLRYNDTGLLGRLLNILGGRQVMIESPLIQELVAENTRTTVQADILAILETRFGEVPQDHRGKNGKGHRPADP